jgi:DNA-binding protein HU-beta
MAAKAKKKAAPKKAAKKAPAKKAAVKKTAVKKAPAKKAAAKKAPAKKAPVKKAAAKKAPYKSTATGSIVTLKQIAADLANKHDLPKKTAEAMLGDMVGETARHVKRGAKVRIPGLGILMVKKTKARMGRNPATGETIKIAAKKKVAFRVAKDLKEAVL